MFDQVDPPSVDNSHLTTEPVSPDSVRLPEFDPEHTLALGETLPPTLTLSIVMVATEEVAAEQVPLLTTALYMVFTTRLL